MLSRKDQSRPGKELPSDWISKVTELLTKTYESELTKNQKSFFVFGETFSDEALLLISITSNSQDNSIPTTFMISFDLEKESVVNNILDTLIDSAGVFIDTYFQDPEQIEYNAIWTEAKFKELAFYYRVTREDVRLYLEANKLLEKE
jgi:hypothetical protein